MLGSKEKVILFNFFSFPLQLRKPGREAALGRHSQVQKAKQDNTAAISEVISESKHELLGFFQLGCSGKNFGLREKLVFCNLNKLSLLLSPYRRMKNEVSNSLRRKGKRVDVY